MLHDHTASCQTVYKSCPTPTSPSNENITLGESEFSIKHEAVITTIIPLTECFYGHDCDVVEFRLLDLVGLRAAISSLQPPTDICVQLDLCDSYHDPIAAGRIIGSFNFEESCQESCSRDGICFAESCSVSARDSTCKNHVAIIGPGTPREAKSVADITAALELPQLLYSTGSDFSDPTRFDYLHQLAPMYQLQVDKIVEIISEMEWKYVAILATADTYGSIGYKLLKKEFEKIESTDEGVDKNCCLQFSIKMLTFKMDYTDIAAQLGAIEDNVKVVIMWMEGKYADRVLDFFMTSGRSDTVYIASDGWSVNTEILQKYGNLLSDHFIGLFPDFNALVHQNSAIHSDEFYGETCRNFPILDEERCARARSLIKDLHVYGYAGGIMSSIEAVYNAMSTSDPSDSDFSFGKLRQKINVNLRERAMNDAGGVKVYTLPNKRLTLAYDSSYYPTGIISTCSKPCAVDQYRVLLKKSPRCCFSCRNCTSNSIVRRTSKQEKCEVCPMCYRPSENRSECVPKPVDRFSILNGDSFSVGIFVVSLVGIFCNGFVMVTLIRNSDTPIVKASSPQLCYIMLVSLMVLLTAPILMVSGPGYTTCPLQRYIIGLGTVIPIAVLFARTNRINVIFNRRSLLTSQLQKMIMSIKYNILLVGIFAAIQFCICLALHVHHEDKSGVDHDLLHIKIMCSPDVEENNFMMCNEHRLDLVYLWIGYVCAMILATSVVAYKTRRLPTNFNEARYICLVMFVVIVLTISTISTFIMLDKRENIMYQCVSIIIAVYSILGIIYGQKMYVIYVIPEENTHCDTNIALKKFIKQDSDQKNSSSSSYSQLLVRHPRHLSMESGYASQSLLGSPRVRKPNGNSPATPRAYHRINPSGNGLTKLTQTATHELEQIQESSATAESSESSNSNTRRTSTGEKKMSVAEKRARFRKGYIRRGKLIKTMSDGNENKRLLIRDERIASLRSEISAHSVSSAEISSSVTDSVSSLNNSSSAFVAE
ncbi:hypothetical protein ACHWQZ_G007098 [Mnemiopsis leidyi]